MKSDIISIDNQGTGFDKAVEEAGKVAVYMGLDEQNGIRLRVMTEELLGLARSVTGKMQAEFWYETAGRYVELHLTTHTVLDKEARYELLQSATSKKNEAASGFLGKLRDQFEQAMANDPDYSQEDIAYDLARDVSTIEEPAEWDGYERSILRNLADIIKIGIRGDMVEMTVNKMFPEI